MRLHFFELQAECLRKRLIAISQRAKIVGDSAIITGRMLEVFPCPRRNRVTALTAQLPADISASTAA